MKFKNSSIMLMIASASLIPMLAMADVQEYGNGVSAETVHILPVKPLMEASSLIAPASIQVTNGNFETGNLNGWGIYRAGNTTGWSTYTGTMSPPAAHPIPFPPEGTYAATSHQGGPNVQILYQDFVLDGHYELSFTLYSHNWASAFYSPPSLSYIGPPNQQYRVDIMLPGAPLLSVNPGDILHTIFQTMPGDPLVTAPTLFDVNLSQWAGQAIRLRFAEVDNVTFYNGSVDDIKLRRTLIEADVDVKPGSCPNPFNARSKGSVPVAIVGSADLDVTTIDPATITLAGVPALVEWEIKDTTQPAPTNIDCSTCFDANNQANFNCDLWDATVNPPVAGTDGALDSYCGDGYLDLIVKFDTQALAAAIAEAERNQCVELELTGFTDDGIPVVGGDSVLIRTKIK